MHAPSRSSIEHRVRRPWQTALIIAVVAVGFLLIALASVVPFSSETARQQIVEVLAARLDGEVQLDRLELRVLPPQDPPALP